MPAGGTALTAKIARELDKPVLVIDLAAKTLAEAAHLATTWLYAWRPTILNVAGPRASEEPTLGVRVEGLLPCIVRADGQIRVPWPPRQKNPDLPFPDG